MTTQNRFEERLLVELQTVVRSNINPAAAAPKRLTGRRISLAGVLTASAVAVGVVTLGGGGAAPAFAVDQDTDGSVTVTIKSLSDATGLQQALRDHGINAVVNYTPLGKMCQQPRGRYATITAIHRPNPTQPAADRPLFTVDPRRLANDDTVVIETNGEGPSSVGISTVTGPVSDCVLVDAPAPAPGSG